MQTQYNEALIDAQITMLNEIATELTLNEVGAESDIVNLSETYLGLTFEDYVLEQESDAEKKADTVTKMVLKKTSGAIGAIANNVKNYVDDTITKTEYEFSSKPLTEVDKNGRVNDYVNRDLRVLVDYDADLENPMSIPRAIENMTNKLVKHNKFFTDSTNVYAQLSSVNFSKLERDSTTVTYVKRHVASFKDKTFTPLIAQSNVYGGSHKLLTFGNKKSFLDTTFGSVAYSSNKYDTTGKSFTGLIKKEELNKLLKWSHEFESNFDGLKVSLYEEWNSTRNIFIDALKTLGKLLASGVIANAMLKHGTSMLITSTMALNPILAGLSSVLVGVGVAQTFRLIVKYITFFWYLIKVGREYTFGIIKDLAKTPMMIDRYVKDVI